MVLKQKNPSVWWTPLLHKFKRSLRRVLWTWRWRMMMLTSRTKCWTRAEHILGGFWRRRICCRWLGRRTWWRRIWNRRSAWPWHIYIYIYVYLRIVFESITFIPRLGDFLVLTSSRVSCICWYVYILTRKEGVNENECNWSTTAQLVFAKPCRQKGIHQNFKYVFRTFQFRLNWTGTKPQFAETFWYDISEAQITQNRGFCRFKNPRNKRTQVDHCWGAKLCWWQDGFYEWKF